MITKFKLFEKKKEKLYKGCLMLFLKIEDWKNKIDELIDDKDIHEEGKEYESHVTVLYGLSNDTDYKDLKEYLEPLKNKDGEDNFKLKISGISIFDNEEYDVLKLDVKSKELNKMNNLLRENFEYKNDYDDYHAHITIAYLKKGTSKKYLNKEFIKDLEIINDKYVYSYYNEDDEKITKSFKK